MSLRRSCFSIETPKETKYFSFLSISAAILGSTRGRFKDSLLERWSSWLLFWEREREREDAANAAGAAIKGCCKEAAAVAAATVAAVGMRDSLGKTESVGVGVEEVVAAAAAVSATAAAADAIAALKSGEAPMSTIVLRSGESFSRSAGGDVSRRSLFFFLFFLFFFFSLEEVVVLTTGELPVAEDGDGGGGGREADGGGGGGTVVVVVAAVTEANVAPVDEDVALEDGGREVASVVAPSRRRGGGQVEVAWKKVHLLHPTL